MAPATFDGFFDLPGELREQILTYLLVKSDGIHINTYSRLDLLVENSPERRFESQPPSLEDSDDDERDELGWPLNYFLVSQTFHREASAVFFGENEFHLYAMPSRLFLRDHGSGARWWPEAAGSRRNKGGGRHGYKHVESLRRIRRAVLVAQRLGGVLETLFLPVLRDMTLAGGLKQLDVRVHLAAQRAQGPASLWGSRLGRALLGLLRDPDLDVARLRMVLGLLLPGSEGGGEVAGWCPRREGPGGSLVTATDREGRVWCDMDIEELARRYGGEEMDIFKVGERPMIRWAAG